MDEAGADGGALTAGQSYLSATSREPSAVPGGATPDIAGLSLGGGGESPTVVGGLSRELQMVAALEVRPV